MTDELSDKVFRNCLAFIEEDLRLKKLSNKELVAECLQTDAADYPIVEEMMTRLDPQWADEKQEEEDEYEQSHPPSSPSSIRRWSGEAGRG